MQWNPYANDLVGYRRVRHDEAFFMCDIVANQTWVILLGSKMLFVSIAVNVQYAGYPNVNNSCGRGEVLFLNNRFRTSKRA